MSGSAGEKTAVCVLVMAALCVLLASCGVPGEKRSLADARPLENPAPSEPSTAAPAPPEIPPYEIGPRDILFIQVENHEELTAQYVVGTDGTIAVPYSEERVGVAGDTFAEAGSRFAEAIRGYTISEPGVRVSLASARSKFYYVLGAVNRKGKFAMGDELLRLRDALVSAGLFADHPWYRPAARKVFVITPQEDKPTYVIVNARDVMLGRLKDDIVIKPGDIVYVPDTAYYRIDVVLDEIVHRTQQISNVSGAAEYFGEDFPQQEYRTFR